MYRARPPGTKTRKRKEAKMIENTKAKLYFAGEPTAHDVQAIRDAFPDLKPGDIVRYDALENIIGKQRSSNRWHTVVAKWRRRIEVDDNLMTRAVIGVGYEILDAKGRIEVSANQYHHGIRRIVTASIRANATDPDELDDAGRHTRAFVIAQGASIKLARRVSPKRVQLPE